jgi:hypothetical protein
MVVKALKSFAGKVSMSIGDTKDISNEAIVKDLLNAGFVTPVKAEDKPEAETETKSEPVKRGRKPKKEA